MNDLHAQCLSVHTLVLTINIVLLIVSCSDNNTVHVMHVKNKCADFYQIT